MGKIFKIEMKVRDYECDSQGIVNNANYLHYFENTRHEFLLYIGLSFSDAHQKGIDSVVTHAELDYKCSLRSDDVFISSLMIDRKGVKVIFHQSIFRKIDNKMCCKAKIEAVILIKGILSRGDYYDKLMEEYFLTKKN
ncbi:MAG: acyl-CoA thioesterase [Bacteroidales bacterium OttesenSCG-928-I14]|jgi:acyl-CoA thioester hydrolase|nr:acyl-CoA thioesterase [Bacteroidales bacterium OttesenSCG-928-I14]